MGAQPDADYAATIPQQTFMIYQLMFAIITPALISGAFAERMKFSAMVLFMVLWSLVVYAPMAHMVWGKGGLLNASLGGRFPTLDFAGGTVVHITSGVSALVCATYLGRRLDTQRKRCCRTAWCSASSAPACCGWGGSDSMRAARLAQAALATSAFVATHFAAARSHRLGRRGMDSQRKAQRAGSNLRMRCRTGRHHARRPDLSAQCRPC